MHQRRKRWLQALFPIACSIFWAPSLAFGAESGPALQSLTQKNDGSLTFTMSEPETFDGDTYQPLGCDISIIGADGTVKASYRFAFDESKTESSYNSGHTAMITKKTVPGSNIQEALSSSGYWEDYQSQDGEFIVDAVMAVSTDGGNTFSGSLETGTGGKATAVPNYFYSDAVLVLSLDMDGDMVFGEGEEGRLVRVYEWSSTDDILGFYNISLGSYSYGNEDFEESSRQDTSSANPSVTEKAESWQAGSGTPYYAAYHDSREYSDGSGTYPAYTDEGPLGMLLPKGGNYVSGITVDSLYGTAEVGLRGAVHTWDFTYSYEYTVIRYDENWEPYLETLSGTVNMPVTRRAYYLYIWGLDLYDFSSAAVENGASGGSVPYTGTDLHLVNQEIGIGTNGPVTSEGLSEYLSAAYGGSNLSGSRPSYEAKLSTSTDGEIHLTDGASQAITSYVPDDDTHVMWASITTDRSLGNIGYINADNAAATAQERAETLAWADANDAVGDGADDTTETTSGTASTFATVINDYLKIGYGGQVVLDGSERSVTFDADGENGDYTTKYSPGNLPPYLIDVIQLFPDTSQETYETSPAFGKSLVTVPDEISSGEYFTGIKTSYQPVLTHTGTMAENTFSIAAATARSTSGTYSAIKTGYMINEPVTVQPDAGDIDSTASIHQNADGSDSMTFRDTIASTQLTDERLTNAWLYNVLQLKLDESYWLVFEDTNEEGDELSEEEEEIIVAKYVHFPFDVGIYRGGQIEYYQSSQREPYSRDYENQEYEDSDGGYYWIQLEGDEWNSLQFYIPPWTVEKVYNSQANGSRILYRVYTISAEEEEEESAPAYEDHPVDCQVSGWLYDFTVLAVDDSAQFSDLGSSAPVGAWYSFYMNGEEKKTGTKNRLGYHSEHEDTSSYVRAGKSGTVTDTWNVRDSVPLVDGKSSKYAGMGTLAKGTSFTFSIKSMSNLWHDEDYLKIKPSLRYISADGTEYEEGAFTVYYNDASEGGSMLVWNPEGGSGASIRMALSDTGFAGAVNEKDLAFTADFSNVTDTAESSTGSTFESIISGMTGSTTGSAKITMNHLTEDALSQAVANLYGKNTELTLWPEMKLGTASRIFTGSAEDLAVNLSTDREAVQTLEDILHFSSDTQKEQCSTLLQASVQEWFGKYEIPAELFVTTKTESEVMEYARRNGLDENSEVFLQGGYLVLHFDITSVRNAQDGLEDDLAFAGNGGDLNMWLSQGQELSVKANGTDLTLQYGDIAVIDLSRSVSDGYRVNSVKIK